MGQLNEGAVLQSDPKRVLLNLLEMSFLSPWSRSSALPGLGTESYVIENGIGASVTGAITSLALRKHSKFMTLTAVHEFDVRHLDRGLVVFEKLRSFVTHRIFGPHIGLCSRN